MTFCQSNSLVYPSTILYNSWAYEYANTHNAIGAINKSKILLENDKLFIFHVSIDIGEDGGKIFNEDIFKDTNSEIKNTQI